MLSNEARAIIRPRYKADGSFGSARDSLHSFYIDLRARSKKRKAQGRDRGGYISDRTAENSSTYGANDAVAIGAKK